MTADFGIQIGEGFAGSGANAAHINTMLGARNGPVGTAFATALAQPSPGHVPFLAVWAPNVPVEPPTLFVNKATISSDAHGSLTWGAAQAGVATGVTEYVHHVVDRSTVRQLALIVAVWVNPDADDSQQVFDNNRVATLAALRRGADSTDNDADSAFAAFATGHRASNPYFQPRNGTT